YSVEPVTREKCPLPEEGEARLEGSPWPLLLLRGRLHHFLGLANEPKGFGIRDVGDGAVRSFFAVVAARFAPAGRGQSALLSEQGEEDLGFLFAESGECLKSAQDFGAV